MNPVVITALFFTQCGFKMDESDESFIDCKIMRTKAGYRARGDCRLSKSVGAQAASSSSRNMVILRNTERIRRQKGLEYLKLYTKG